MNLPPALEKLCSEALGEPVLEVSFLGGGDICAARLLKTKNGQFFLKYREEGGSPSFFETEAKGLDLLRSRSPIRIPEVLASGASFLLLEYIEPGRADNAFWENSGISLARLHLNSAPQYGLDFDNFIGSLPQVNTGRALWPDFYREMRLEPQFKRAFDEGLLSKQFIPKIERLFTALPDIIPPGKPALIHGDLWSGNFLVSRDREPVLIDPAVCYAHREMDLAMSRLFGGFDWRFYRGYESVFPSPPGLEERLPIHQLYYLMVHVNLFGHAYLRPVTEILNRF